MFISNYIFVSSIYLFVITVTFRGQHSENPRPILFDYLISDLQNVNITLRILFRPQARKLHYIYTNLGVDYDERVLPSIVSEVMKAVVFYHSNFPVPENLENSILYRKSP